MLCVAMIDIRQDLTKYIQFLGVTDAKTSCQGPGCQACAHMACDTHEPWSRLYLGKDTDLDSSLLFTTLSAFILWTAQHYVLSPPYSWLRKIMNEGLFLEL